MAARTENGAARTRQLLAAVPIVHLLDLEVPPVARYPLMVLALLRAILLMDPPRLCGALPWDVCLSVPVPAVF